jgi:hypothetical protein
MSGIARRSWGSEPANLDGVSKKDFRIRTGQDSTYTIRKEEKVRTTNNQVGECQELLSCGGPVDRGGCNNWDHTEYIREE